MKVFIFALALWIYVLLKVLKGRTLVETSERTEYNKVTRESEFAERIDTEFVCTTGISAKLDKIAEIKKQLDALEKLQIEMDVANLENCTVKTLKVDIDKDVNYIFDVAANELQRKTFVKIIEEERNQLNTSLAAEIKKISATLK